MTVHNLTVRETVVVTDDIPTGQSKLTDLLETVETFTGQTQLTSELVSVIETIGPPMVSLRETAAVLETFYTGSHHWTVRDSCVLTEGFDTSTSVLANAKECTDLTSVVETFTVGGSFTGEATERVSVYETFYAIKRVDYQDQDKYYYAPRQ